MEIVNQNYIQVTVDILLCLHQMGVVKFRLNFLRVYQYREIVLFIAPSPSTITHNDAISDTICLLTIFYNWVPALLNRLSNGKQKLTAPNDGDKQSIVGLCKTKQRLYNSGQVGLMGLLCGFIWFNFCFVFPSHPQAICVGWGQKILVIIPK